MSKLSQEELAKIGEEVLAKKEAQKEYDRKYNGRVKWANEQYKKFALENGFTLPEFPEELK